MLSRPKTHTRKETDISLPKIIRSPSRGSYQLKYDWTNRSQYLLLSNQEIKEQQQYLQEELQNLHKQIFSKKPYLKIQESQVKARLNKNMNNNLLYEIQNNINIINKLKNQYQQLQKQAQSTKKVITEVQIIETKQKINKTKNKIKQLKQKSKIIGDKIQKGQDPLQQPTLLQNQRNKLINRKNQIYQKLSISIANLQRMNLKSQDLQNKVIQAQQYLKQNCINQKNESQERQKQGQLRQRQYQIQILKKMIQSQRLTKQQKCLQLLKQVQAQQKKNDQLLIKQQKLNAFSLLQKNKIVQLQQLLIQSSKETPRSKTSQSLQKFHKLNTNKLNVQYSINTEGQLQL